MNQESLQTEIIFRFMEKSESSDILPHLFSVLYENMHGIDPTGNTYEQDRALFCDEVGPALQKENRHIVLITHRGALIGFLQYYTNDTVFMIEEAQLKRDYQGRGIMRELFRFLSDHIPRGIPYVEAFTLIYNKKPQEILRRHGFECVEDNCGGRFCRFRGDCTAFFAGLGKHT